MRHNVSSLVIATSAVLLMVAGSLVYAAAGTVSWEPLSSMPAMRAPYVDDLYIAGKYGVALVHHRYLWLSESFGANWTREIDLRDPGGLHLPVAKIPTAVALRGPRIYVAGVGFVATFDGSTWTYRTPTFENVETWQITDIAAPRVASSKAYAVGWMRRPGDNNAVRRPFVIRTTDNGNTWERWGVPPVEPGAGNETALLAVAVARDGTVVVSGTNAVLAEHSESGGPWENLNPPGGWGSLSGAGRVIQALAVGGGTANHTIWAGRRDGKVMIKRGNNPWVVKTVEPDFYIRDIAFRSANDGVAFGFSGTLTNRKIFSTRDGGNTWVQEPITEQAKGTSFNVEASSSNTIDFIADVVVPRGPTHTNCSWLMQRRLTIHIPPQLRRPLMRRPFPPIGPGPVERIPGEIGQPRAPQVR